MSLEPGSSQTHPHTNIPSTAPFCVFLKSCFPTSDLLAQYGLQAPTDLTCLAYGRIRTPTL
jgi:hypothetical protein